MRARERPAESGAGAVRKVGDVIAGRYFVEQRLGAGGMGSVYKVFDQSTQKALALKELGGRVAQDDVTEGQRLRFRREFHTMAQLKHPRIVQVFEFGLDGDK